MLVATGRHDFRLDKIEDALIPKQSIEVILYENGDSAAEIARKDALVESLQEAGVILVVYEG